MLNMKNFKKMADSLPSAKELSESKQILISMHEHLELIAETNIRILNCLRKETEQDISQYLEKSTIEFKSHE